MEPLSGTTTQAPSFKKMVTEAQKSYPILMAEKTKKWEKFEGDIASFVTRMGFSDVEQNFKIHGDKDSRNEIDVLCGKDSYVFVVECKTKDKVDSGSGIKKWVDILNGRRERYQQILGSSTKYKGYPHLLLILALSDDFFPTEGERSYAKKSGVHIWDARYISYYEQYPASLRSVAPYHILADAGAKMTAEATKSVVAFKSKIKINGHEIDSYMFAASPAELLRHCYVARREQGTEGYYQRLVNGGRLNLVARYIEAGGSFVNNAILAFDNGTEKLKLSFDSAHAQLKKLANDELIKKLYDPNYNLEVGILQFPLSYKSFWVIDGQHRIFGYSSVESKLQETSSLPVVLLDGISLEDQMRLFVDINHKQKTINADLIWDIRGEISPTELDGSISNLVKNIDEKGPLQKSIKIPARRQRAPINLSAFCRAIKKTGILKKNVRWVDSVPNPCFSQKGHPATAAKVAPTINAYFEALKKILSEDQFESIANSTSIEIFVALHSLLLPAIDISKSASDIQKYFEVELRPLVAELSSQLIKNIKKATGEALKDEQTRILFQIISRQSANAVIKKISSEIAEATSDYRVLEQGLRYWMANVFDRYSTTHRTFDEWFLKKCPQYFDRSKYEILLKRHKEQDRYKGHEMTLLDMLDMGNMLFLMREIEIRDLFKSCREELGTLKPDDIINHINFVRSVRNLDSHGNAAPLSAEEIQQAKNSQEILLKNIDLVKTGIDGDSDEDDVE